jgi:hypothetical protein
VWDDTLLNRCAFDERKVLEQDNGKVNSDVLENSFDFTGAFVDGADFSKAKLIVPSIKQEITVEEALKRIHQSEKKFENRLNQNVDLVTPMNRGIARENAKKRFDEKENRRNELKQILSTLFPASMSVTKKTKFSSNTLQNKDYKLQFKELDNNGEYQARFGI